MAVSLTVPNCAGSQQRRGLSQWLTCLSTFSKTTSPSSVAAGTWMNSSGNTAHDSKMQEERQLGWTGETLWAPRKENTTSKMFSEKCHFRATWKSLTWGNGVSNGSFERCSIQRARGSIRRHFLHHPRYLTALVRERIIKTAEQGWPFLFLCPCVPWWG